MLLGDVGIVTHDISHGSLTFLTDHTDLGLPTAHVKA